jgi:hypothetical protein
MSSCSFSERSGLCPTPSTIPGYNNDRLPDPFLYNDGLPVLTKAGWACRQQQIGALVQGYEAGFLPPRPPVVSGALATNATANTANLTVTAGLSKAHTVQFSNTITYPSGKAPKGGWPLLIAYDGLSIPVPDGVCDAFRPYVCRSHSMAQIATLVYNNDNIGLQNDATSRGIGLFFDLYGANATASAMTAWVWGISRTIDALESLPKAKINTKKIAVTGCSRDGKGALMAGAFEPRIALTIPQESGSGGDTCVRDSSLSARPCMLKLHTVASI